MAFPNDIVPLPDPATRTETDGGSLRAKLTAILAPYKAEIEGLRTKLGWNNSADATSIDYKVARKADLVNGKVPTGQLGTGTADSTKALLGDGTWGAVSGGGGGGAPSGAAGGDLGGTYPDPSVIKLQGRAVTGAAPSTNQVLGWNGSAWVPTTPSGTGSGAGLTGDNVFTGKNTFQGPVIVQNDAVIDVRSMTGFDPIAADHKVQLQAAIDLAKSQGGGYVFLSPKQQFRHASELNVYNTHGITLGGVRGRSGTGVLTPQSDLIFTSATARGTGFMTADTEPGRAIYARRSTNFQMLNLRYIYTSEFFYGILVDFGGPGGTGDASLAVLKNCEFRGENQDVSCNAYALVSTKSIISSLIESCEFHYAKYGIIGDGDTYSNMVIIKDCHFSALGATALHNAIQSWIIDGCTFEPNAGTGQRILSGISDTDVPPFTVNVNTTQDFIKPVTTAAPVPSVHQPQAPPFIVDIFHLNTLERFEVTAMTATSLTIGTRGAPSAYDAFPATGANQSLPASTINTYTGGGGFDLSYFPTSGRLKIVTSNGPQYISYTGKTSSSFTGVTGGTGTITASTVVDGLPTSPSRIAAMYNHTANENFIRSVAGFAGAYSEDNGAFGPVNFYNCWMGDANGKTPWIQYAGRNLNLIGNFLQSGADASIPLVTLNGLFQQGCTISHNYLAGNRIVDVLATNAVGLNIVYNHCSGSGPTTVGEFETLGAGYGAISNHTYQGNVNGPPDYINTDVQIGDHFKIRDGTVPLAADPHNSIGVSNSTGGMMYRTRTTGGTAPHEFWTDLTKRLAITTDTDVLTGDLIVSTVGKGIVAKSPNGTLYRLTPPNGGGAATWVAV